MLPWLLNWLKASRDQRLPCPLCMPGMLTWYDTINIETFDGTPWISQRGSHLRLISKRLLISEDIFDLCEFLREKHLRTIVCWLVPPTMNCVQQYWVIFYIWNCSAKSWLILCDHVCNTHHLVIMWNFVRFCGLEPDKSIWRRTCIDLFSLISGFVYLDLDFPLQIFCFPLTCAVYKYSLRVSFNNI